VVQLHDRKLAEDVSFRDVASQDPKLANLAYSAGRVPCLTWNLFGETTPVLTWEDAAGSVVEADRRKNGGQAVAALSNAMSPT
jgi:hypothetical protein